MIAAWRRARVVCRLLQWSTDDQRRARLDSDDQVDLPAAGAAEHDWQLIRRGR